MNEEKNETRWDRLLAVRTTGRDDTNADQYRYPYEPTPYSVLERLANSGLIRKENTLLDYGCGKGRVDFFMSYQTRCQSIGVEYNERIYEKAMNNKESAVASGRVSFALANAERYTVPELLKKVIARILNSYYENRRTVKLFFYYPSDEYIAYLMTVEELLFSDEIDCRDLFDGNNVREKIVIFEIAV